MAHRSSGEVAGAGLEDLLLDRDDRLRIYYKFIEG